ncbi:50S ribosomal protein L5 [Flavobacteriales bacterium]|jgi:large subunit ribosomal protein L5|nr:50S ribosomal protein L5 [Flavobacteriales bacterium]
MGYTPRLKEKYAAEVAPKLQEEFSYSTPMQLPKLTKICLSQGLGNSVGDKRLLESAVKEMTLIAGQKAVQTYSKKDISNFKLRKGMPIGTRVTLRGDVMYEFLDKLVSVALPRVRDFRGIRKNGFDGSGNYNMGITEHIIFPEIDIDKVNNILGMDITFVTTAGTDKEAFSLLKELGLPFKTDDK